MAKIAKIQLPDGRIARFSVPDDMTEEEVMREAPNFVPTAAASSALDTQSSGGILNGLISQAGKNLSYIANNPDAEIPTIFDAVGSLQRTGDDAISATGRALSSREGLRAAGATAGALAPYAIGATLGPVGMAGASLLGGIAGAATGDVARDVIAPSEAPKTLEEAKNRLLGSSIEEAGSQAIGYALPPAAKMAFSPFKAVSKGLSGATSKAATDLMKKAEEFGIDLAPANLKDSKFIDGWKRVIGVMPWAGSGFSKTAASQADQTGKAANRILDEIAPNATLYDAGTDLVAAAEKSSERFRNEANRLYTNFENKANSLPDSMKSAFKPDAIKSTASEILTRRASANIPGVPSLVNDPAINTIDALSKIEGNLSATQLRGLSKEINNSVAQKKMAGEDVSDLLSIKKSIESAFNDVDESVVGKEVADDLRGSLKAANDFFSENVKVFQTSQAQKFGKIDKNMFKVGFSKPGKTPDDQAIKAVFDGSSPQAIKELRDVVGNDAFNTVARKHLETGIKTIIKDNGGAKYVDPSEFIKKYRLDTDEGKLVMREMLSGSKLPPDQIEKFVDVINSVSRVSPTDPSSFIMRRLTLGGIGAASVLSGGTSMVPTAALLYLANRFTDALTNPTAMKNLIRAADSGVSPRMKFTALVRGVRALYGDEEADKLKYEDFNEQSVDNKEGNKND